MRQADFVLPVPLQPKARPRFRRFGKAYTDEKYRAWMSNVSSILSEWWLQPPLQKGELIALHLTFYGPGTSDLDNLAGAVMDAGQGIVWQSDRVTCIRRLELEWEGMSKKEQSIYLKVIYK
jgi:Holliday junction resolvase RusA-like endonuclease